MKDGAIFNSVQGDNDLVNLSLGGSCVLDVAMEGRNDNLLCERRKDGY